MTISRDEISKHALRELAHRNPELSLQQLAVAMRDAEWDWESDPVVVKFRLPAQSEDIKLEITVAKTDD